MIAKYDENREGIGQRYHNRDTKCFVQFPSYVAQIAMHFPTIVKVNFILAKFNNTSTTRLSIIPTWYFE